MYANGLLPADRIQRVINNVGTLTPADVRALQADKRVVGPNTARDLKRGYLKRCMWPNLYWAAIRVKNMKSDQEVHLYVYTRLNVNKHIYVCIHTHLYICYIYIIL
jgi:hypothetical protein